MRGKIAAGAAWVFLFRLADRILGVASTLILARLLLPADFGVVAMASAVIAVVELATAFGFELALVQHQNPDRRHYDTAWTLNIILALISAATISLLALPAAWFFNEPRVTGVMLVVALAWLIGGFENIGVVDFRRRMEFVREFKFMAAKRLVGFVCTVAAAIVFESYWALLAGIVAARATGLVFSYVMQSFRPRLGLSMTQELMGFSRWTLLSNVLTAGLQRAPHFFVGRVLGPEPLGFYVIATDVGRMPTTELAAPMNRAAIPGYSRLVQNPPLLKSTFLDISGLVGMIAIPVGLGLAAVAEPAVRVLLGEKWLATVPLIQILSVSGMFVAVGSNFGAICVALGRPRLNSWFLGIRLIVLALGLALLVRPWGAVGAAWAELAGAAASFAYAAWVALRQAEVGFGELAARLWRPSAAGALMVWLVMEVLNFAHSAPASLQLAAGVLAGATAFAATVMALWWLGGRESGTESQLWDRLVLQLRLLRVKFSRSGE